MQNRCRRRKNWDYCKGGVMCVGASLRFFVCKYMFEISGRFLGQWKCDNKIRNKTVEVQGGEFYVGIYYFNGSFLCTTSCDS